MTVGDVLPGKVEDSCPFVAPAERVLHQLSTNEAKENGHMIDASSKGLQHLSVPYLISYPLALRANPATVPGVKLVMLAKLVKLVTLSISNQTKIDQHRPQNRPKIVLKSIKNRPKIDQDRPKIEL